MLPKELLEDTLSVGVFSLEAYERFKKQLWEKQASYMESVAEIEYKLGLGLVEEARSHKGTAKKILSIAKGI